MTAPDLIAAFKSATPTEAIELAAVIADLLANHSAPAHVEALRTTLQVGDRYTITRQAVTAPGGMDAPRKTGGAMG